jgi:hypothetical protein
MKLPIAWVPVLLTSAVGKSAVERTERAADGRGAAGGCCSGPVAVAACHPRGVVANQRDAKHALDSVQLGLRSRVDCPGDHH